MFSVDLSSELQANAHELRDPDVVMAPERLGAARLTRYAFSRSLLRRVHNAGWVVSTVRFDMDRFGHGEVAYRIEAEGHTFHFVAFLQTLPEDAHTDRVIADRWEIAAALVEGELDAETWDVLRAEVPAQERARLNARVLTLTRGNRSVRFFDYLVGELSEGRQPDPNEVADAGYIMRSTAFYGNGKYGMRSFEGFGAGHPLAASYRAQFLGAWCFRELSYDTVEHCARLRGGDAAVAFDDGWRTFFGLGNATGLGLVPYGFKHPRIINAWIGVRELALARVRALDGTPELIARFSWWLDRAIDHFATGTSDDAEPFLSPAELVAVAQELREGFVAVADHPKPFDSLMQWAMGRHVELAELAVALLVELDVADDDVIDQLLTVDESADVELALPIADALELLQSRFGWALHSNLGDSERASQQWVFSDNAEEPRRLDRAALDQPHHDMSIGIASAMRALADALHTWPADSPLGEVAAMHPEHLYAIERLFVSDQRYGEPRDNPCTTDYLPLQIQRFQLAQYGMDNFKPKSTDWLRVTLFQGAPRVGDLGGAAYGDDWVLPPLPQPAEG